VMSRQAGTNLYWIGPVLTANSFSKIRTSHVWLKKFINDNEAQVPEA